MSEPLLRFAVVRPPNRSRRRQTVRLEEPTLLTLEGDFDGIHRSARGFLRTGPAIRALSDVAFGEQLDELAIRLAEASNSGDDHNADSSVDEILGEMGLPPSQELVARSEWVDALRRINDTLVAASVAGYNPVGLTQLARVFRAARAVEAVAEAPQADARVFASMILELPPSASTASLRTSVDRLDPEQARLELARKTARRASELAERLDALEAAARQLACVRVRDVVPADGMLEVQDCEERVAPRIGGIIRSELDLVRARLVGVNDGADRECDADSTRLVLSPDALSRLRADLQPAFASLGGDPSTTPLRGLASGLRRHIETTQHQLAGLIGDASSAKASGGGGWLGGAHVTGVSPFESTEMAVVAAPENLHPMVEEAWPRIAWAALTGVDGIEPAGGIVYPGEIPVVGDLGPSFMEPVGEAELFEVRQQIVEYRRGELSHVENVLRTEFRERSHSRRVLTEEVFEEETEAEREEDRDLQSTDRSELSRETERVVQERTEREAGARVSADYGRVEVEAEARIRTERAVEDSARVASEIARETVEKAVKRVRERVARRRRQRMVEEAEERNVHRFDNSADGESNISGLYQWLDKVYKAEVWSIGRRTLYDVIVPEPAAMLLAAVEREKEAAPTPPDPLEVTVEELDRGAHGDATVAELVERYGVTERIPPIPQPRTVSVSFSNVADRSVSDNFFGADTAVEIPDGYRSVSARISLATRSDETEADRPRPPLVGITVAGYTATYRVDTIVTLLRAGLSTETIGDGTRLTLQGGAVELPELPLNLPADVVGGTLPVSVILDDYSAATITVTIECRPTEDLLHSWRLDAYRAIRGAYDQRLSEYRAEVASQRAYGLDGGPMLAVLGRNPGHNRRTIAAELQRVALTRMRNAPLGWNNIRLHPTPTDDQALPEPNTALLTRFSPEIRFLQQAFEWNNMTWIFYPYFYGRRSNWPNAVLWEGVDADFLAFLQAGAARVIVPARLGFEGAVAHYMRTREPWLGGEEPGLGDSNWVDYLEEIRAALGAGSAGTHHEDQDFDVVVPTTLVSLRPDDRLPRWERDEAGVWREVEA